MLKISTLQKITLSFLSSLALLLFGLVVLGISLFAANRQQAANINQVSTDIINAYTQNQR